MANIFCLLQENVESCRFSFSFFFLLLLFLLNLFYAANVSESRVMYVPMLMHHAAPNGKYITTTDDCRIDRQDKNKMEGGNVVFDCISTRHWCTKIHSCKSNFEKKKKMWKKW